MLDGLSRIGGLFWPRMDVRGISSLFAPLFRTLPESG